MDHSDVMFALVFRLRGHENRVLFVFERSRNWFDMKLVLTLLCRDEIDVIEPMLDFHFAHGVDQIIATDNGSVDGTTEVLEAYERSGRLTLIREPRHTHQQALWVTRMAEIAYRDCAAGWIIHSDADEFWWPTTGNLKTALAMVPGNVDAISVERTNFLPSPAVEPHGVPFHQRMIFREKTSFNSLGHLLPGKVCHRARRSVSVMPGNHSVCFSGRSVDSLLFPEVSILHYPARSYEQFERKIRQGARALLRNPDRQQGEGGTWLYLYENYYRHGRLREYYETLTASDAVVRRRLAHGDIMFDDRLASYFRDFVLPQVV